MFWKFIKKMTFVLWMILMATASYWFFDTMGVNGHRPHIGNVYECQGIYKSLDHLEYYSTGHKNLTETYFNMDCDTIYRARSDDYGM